MTESNMNKFEPSVEQRARELTWDALSSFSPNHSQSVYYETQLTLEFLAKRAILAEDKLKEAAQQQIWDCAAINAQTGKIVKLEQQRNALLKENKRLKTCSTIEMMLANPNIDSFVQDKEKQIEQLQQRIKELEDKLNDPLNFTLG